MNWTFHRAPKHYIASWLTLRNTVARQQNISMFRETLKMSEIGNIVRSFPLSFGLQLRLSEYVVTPAGTWFWTDGLSVSKPCQKKHEILRSSKEAGFWKLVSVSSIWMLLFLRQQSPPQFLTETKVKSIKKTNSSYRILPVTHPICSPIAG